MGKLCEDQLVGRLVAIAVAMVLIADGLTVTAAAQVDGDARMAEAVAPAKGRLTAEAKQVRRNDFEKLFDTQIATLKDRGTPEQIVKFLQYQKDVVLTKASEMTIGDGNIPFLPVIPLSFRSLYDLMAMVRNGEKTGYIYVSPTAISDAVVTSSYLYYIYDVEDGSTTRGKSPKNAEEDFRLQKRSPLTIAEVMALEIRTDVLSRHYVWAVGSRFVSDIVPRLLLDGGRPVLDTDWAGRASQWLGSASCGNR